jgi:hypothetical protein
MRIDIASGKNQFFKMNFPLKRVYQSPQKGVTEKVVAVKIKE